jgi:hypothetical protein
MRYRKLRTFDRLQGRLQNALTDLSEDATEGGKLAYFSALDKDLRDALPPQRSNDSTLILMLQGRAKKSVEAWHRVYDAQAKVVAALRADVVSTNSLFDAISRLDVSDRDARSKLYHTLEINESRARNETAKLHSSVARGIADARDASDDFISTYRTTSSKE